MAQNISKSLLITAFFLILLVPFAAAKKTEISFQLLNSNVNTGVMFINLFLAVLVVVFVTSVARSSASANDAWGFIVISTIFLAILTATYVLRNAGLLQIQGIENVLRFLFFIFFLIGLYKLNNKPA